MTDHPAHCSGCDPVYACFDDGYVCDIQADGTCPNCDMEYVEASSA